MNPRQLTVIRHGSAVAGAGVGRLYFGVPLHVTGMLLSAAEAPVGSSVTVDIASPAGVTTGNVGTLAAGKYSQPTIFATAFLLSPGVGWQFKLIQVGSGSPGVDICASLIASEQTPAKWVVLDPTRLAAFLSQNYLDKLTSSGVGGAQPSPDGVDISDVVEAMRGKLRSNPFNSISATAGSLPPEAIVHACWLVVQALQSRLPAATLELTKSQKDNITEAKDWLASRSEGLNGKEPAAVVPPYDPEQYSLPQLVRSGDDGNHQVALPPGANTPHDTETMGIGWREVWPN